MARLALLAVRRRRHNAPTVNPNITTRAQLREQMRETLEGLSGVLA